MAETFYRLNNSIIENNKGLLGVQVYRSGDISHATTVQLNITKGKMLTLELQKNIFFFQFSYIFLSVGANMSESELIKNTNNLSVSCI